ncbi:hypothetical protein CPB84DRAFT_1455075 [Gymnopilus junonius]|uniref:Mug135-like C-terminal domain-containing protein n=1 Tax=Gymnopilus junonius TaxID=109634 RepID=A0A9P5NJP6_GYMJU|nr:hypothetical protein CPB84DRAFT_1455075 [Gymnopilus junonius]
MPPVIALPLLSNESAKTVKLPAPPSQPPTVTDITNSLHYSQDLLVAHGRKKVKDEEVFQAELYKNKLISSHEGGEPAWFTAAMNRILDEQLAPIKADIRTLKDDVHGLKGELSSVRRIAAITYNMSAGTGDEAGFEIVPFPNGQDPTKAPHNLPPLKCAKDVKELSTNGDRRDQYYRGYYPPTAPARLPPISERIDKIFVAIGAKNY